MVRTSPPATRLLVAGTNLPEVMEYGSLLSAGFSQVILSHSPEPMARAADATDDPALVCVVLWHKDEDQKLPTSTGRLLIVSLDGTYPDERVCRMTVTV